MSTALVDFLNHGVLPFIGRERTIEKIVSFWQSSSESSELRAALLVGEAGIGKSRLIEEALPRFLQKGGVVVHTRLYPEAIASISPMIARAIRLLNTARHLPISDPDESLGSVVATLRRLARLRPALLVIEDMHLLEEGAPAEEMSRLLAALADEPIPLLVVSRPVNRALRGLLERYLVDEMEIPQLDEIQTATLWETIFERRAEDDLIKHLCEATLGNPLALRSALRGAVTSGAIAHDRLDDRWKATIPHDQLSRLLRTNVRLLSEGMTAHLTDIDRKAATRLASLGEVFSREAAAGMIENADEVLERLTFKGIIIQTSVATPLPGNSSEYPPFAFSQTVLHRYLIDEEKIDTNALVKIIAAEFPLYSTLPFRLVASHPRTDAVNATIVRRAILRLLELGRLLDTRSDWHLGIDALEGGEALAIHHRQNGDTDAEGRRSPDEELLDAELLICRFMILRRSNTEQERRAIAEQLMRLTDSPTPEHLLDHRLLALTLMMDPGVPDEKIFDTVWHEARVLVEGHPDLRFNNRYLGVLEAISGWAAHLGDGNRLAIIEEEIRLLMDAPEASADYSRLARHILVLHFLDSYSDREGLEKRRRDLYELEPVVDPKRRMTFLFHKLVFYRTLGEYEKYLEIVATALPLFRIHGFMSNHAYASLGSVVARLSLHEETGDLQEMIDRLLEPVPAGIRPRFLLFIQIALLEVAVLRGNRSWSAVVHSLAGEACRYLRPEAQIILALEQGCSREFLAETARVATDGFRPVVDLLLEGELRPEPATFHILRRALAEPMLRINHAIERIAILLLVRNLRGETDDTPAFNDLCTAASTAAVETLEWMAERNLLPFLASVIDRFGNCFAEPERTSWEQRIARLQQETVQKRRAEGGGPLRARLSMVGAIEFTASDGTVIPMRGSKARALLGLMVADQMLDQPLSQNEFAAIITGINDSPERARRSLNGVVYRLRDMIGHDLVRTDNEAPRLNVLLVEVDLLAGVRAISQGERSLRDGLLQHALAATRSAIEILGGDIPFPTLYERFFEAARDDIEYRLRSLIRTTAQRLLDEDDPTEAEALLRKGLEAIPDDEDLVDLLRQALGRIGRRIEAERLRIFGLMPERG